jgi:hypothetical protein
LRQTKFLPSLDDHSWDGTGAADPLTEAQKLDIRLARLDLRVIKRGSDPKAKFDLFQRLNSFGSTLEPQEIRSALIAATNSECLAWLTRLAASEDFRSCVSLSERLVDVQYDVELVLRFMMLHSYDTDGPANRLGDFSAKLDDWSIDLAANFACRHEELQEVFLTTFGTLATHGAEDVFRKWNGERFRGPFLNTAFEVIALGTGYHVANGSAYRTDPLDASRELWGRDQMRTRFATGLATQDRFQLTLPLGRQLMSAPVG